MAVSVTAAAKDILSYFAVSRSAHRWGKDNIKNRQQWNS